MQAADVWSELDMRIGGGRVEAIGAAQDTMRGNNYLATGEFVL